MSTAAYREQIEESGRQRRAGVHRDLATTAIDAAQPTHGRDSGELKCAVAWTGLITPRASRSARGGNGHQFPLVDRANTIHDPAQVALGRSRVRKALRRPSTCPSRQGPPKATSTNRTPPSSRAGLSTRSAGVGELGLGLDGAGQASPPAGVPAWALPRGGVPELGHILDDIFDDTWSPQLNIASTTGCVSGRSSGSGRPLERYHSPIAVSLTVSGPLWARQQNHSRPSRLATKTAGRPHATAGSPQAARAAGALHSREGHSRAGSTSAVRATKLHVVPAAHPEQARHFMAGA